VEDGYGGEVVYPQGSAFIEPPGRVHRGIAGDVPVETVQTFLVPAGSAFSVNVPPGCGALLAVDEARVMAGLRLLIHGYSRIKATVCSS
jgi:hypothetical protein